jgi:glycogen debranching enzyme
LTAPGTTSGGSRASTRAARYRRRQLPTPTIRRATDLTGVLILKHDDLFLLTDPFGDVHPDSRGLGLYQADTRLLSHYEIRVNDHRPVILRTGVGGSFTSRLQLTNPAYLRNPDPEAAERLSDPHGPDPEIGVRAQSLGILRERVLAGGFRERVTIDNFTTVPEHQRISLRLAADFADIFEVRGLQRESRGEYLPAVLGPDRVVFSYRGLDGIVRRTHVALSEPATEIAEDEPALEFDWLVPPGGQRTLEIVVWGETDEPGSGSEDPLGDGWEPGPAPLVVEDEAAAAHRSWRASSASVSVPDAYVARAIRRSLADLRLLVNQGPGLDERYVAAGVPWFTCLFGRDSIITSLQLLSVRPQIACETLELLAGLQATVVDEWRDAQPGKILHELRTGEMARAGEIPHTPYYGSVDSTPLWLILLGETHAWTGDDALLERLWPNALAALRWIDEFGDVDGDGFVEFERTSPRGLVNQGWKDSRDANRFRDGRLALQPLALVEVQAYVYAARRHLARLARVRRDEGLAEAQEIAAGKLRERFEEAFWMDDVGTYALALDGDKRQADAIGSNAGHALWCGLASPEHAARVASSLMSPPMWSGWGVRTLSSEMAGYNPIGYHIGSVWPHDNAIIAEGLIRYGFREEANRIAGAILESTTYFRDSRLPELFCGFDRGESPYPVPYPVACIPQAWAAGSVFQLLATMLGFRPNASLRELELVSPTLPEWLREVRVENMRVGDATVDLVFTRSDGSTGVEVLRRTGDVSVVLRI